MTDKLRAAIQEILDADGEGWSVGQFVIVMGLERVNADGSVESTPWWWAPSNQPDWMTGGLLEAVLDQRAIVPDDC